MRMYLPNCNPWPRGFTNQAKYQIHQTHTRKHVHFDNKVHSAQFPAPHTSLSVLFFTETLRAETSGFQVWCKNTQESEKPKGKTKQPESPAFCRHFSLSFLTIKPT